MTTQNISALDTGTYSVTITDAHNCRATDDFIVGNDAIFGITATPDSARIKLGQNVDLNISATGSSIASLIWSPSSDLSCSDCVNPNASPIQTIKYFVTAYDPNGCEAKEDVVVIVAPEYEVFIPNAFTPNGDGNNDYFEIFGNKEAWKHFEVDVFNRLGEKVFESNDMNFKWDGTFRGKPESPSVFVYMVRVVYLNNYTDKMFKGSVTLLR